MSSLFNFTPEDNTALVQPKSIIQEQCDELLKLTNNLVIGKIEEYDGPIDSYKSNFASTIASSLQQEFDVQTELGDVSENSFTYEFYLSSKYTPKFKYRVLFINYGITYYPLKIVLDETIATQIGCENTIQLENESEFKTVLGKILNSDKLKSVINSLFALNVQELQKDF